MNMCPPSSGGLGERQSCTKGRVRSVKTGLIPGAVRTNTAQVQAYSGRKGVSHIRPRKQVGDRLCESFK